MKIVNSSVEAYYNYGYGKIGSLGSFGKIEKNYMESIYRKKCGLKEIHYSFN